MSLVAEFYRRTRQRVQKSSLELTRANEELRHLSSKLLTAHEGERKRIAGEIHDTFGAYLTAIRFKVDSALQEMENGSVASESLKGLLPIIQQVIEESRRIQMDLRPSILDDLGIKAALLWFCQRFQTIYSSIRIETDVTFEENEVPESLRTVIFRISQEALNNIAKHSKADRVILFLRKTNAAIELGIKDNGQGFEVKEFPAAESYQRGLGLSSMRERAQLSGGSISIESIKGKGTTIRASWPIE